MKLCIPKKKHECRVCGQYIQVGEPCASWSGIINGQGWFRSHAHPACSRFMSRHWEYDWEILDPGDISRQKVNEWEEKLLFATATIKEGGK